MWVVIFSFQGSSWFFKDQTCLSWLSCIGRQVLHHWAPWGALSIHVAAVLPHVIGSRSAPWKRTLFPCECGLWELLCPLRSSISSPIFCWLPRPFAQISDQSKPWVHPLQSSGGPCAQPCPRFLGSLDVCSVPWGHWLSLASPPCSVVWKLPWGSNGDHVGTDCVYSPSLRDHASVVPLVPYLTTSSHVFCMIFSLVIVKEWIQPLLFHIRWEGKSINYFKYKYKLWALSMLLNILVKYDFNYCTYFHHTPGSTIFSSGP